MKNYDEAYKLFSILRQSDPDNPLPYLQIARIEKEQGDLEKAVKYMMRASSLAPEEAEPAKELAILLYDSKRITDALPMFKTVLDRRPDDVESNYYLGQIYVNFQNYKAAYNHFLKSKNGGAYAAKSLLGIAEILRHFNKNEESLKVLEAVTKFPKLQKEELLEARYQLGETHLAVKDIQNAIAQWEKILSVVKDYRDVSSKIDKYEQMKTNSKLHAYMMSAYPEFVGLCEHAAKHFAKSVIVIRTEPQRDSSIEIYTQAVVQGNVGSHSLQVLSRDHERGTARRAGVLRKTERGESEARRLLHGFGIHRRSPLLRHGEGARAPRTQGAHDPPREKVNLLSGSP